jgi:hypothetical protein
MSLSRQWIRVNKDSPCPICGKADWCAVTEDGTLVRCQRVEQGAFKTGTDKAGTIYYLHRLNSDGPRPAAEMPPRVSGAEDRRADPDALHAAYDALLGQLVLSHAHREQLHRRGLTDAEIDRRVYRSLPVRGRARLARNLAERFGDSLLSVPGFVVKEGKDARRYPTIAGAAGLLVPCRDPAGRVVALKVRRDAAGDGPRYAYLSSANHGGPGPSSPVHVPLGVTTPCQYIRLTEGELKADVALCLSKLATIGLPGVAGWKCAVAVLHELRTEIVRVGFDADAGEKPAVARALAACVEGLTAQGFGVEVERWPAADGKGIDDVLAAGKTPEVLAGDTARQYVAEVLAEGTAGEGPAAPDPLKCLDTMLSEGGAEGLYRDKELLQALAKLAETDIAEFNCRRAQLRKHGVRLRELDAALTPLRQAIRSERPPLTSAGEYKVTGGRIVRVRPTKDGPVEDVLCNFAARIVAQTTVDDGAERSIHLTIDGALADGTPLPRIEVPAEKFGWLEWIVPSWGTRAVVGAGRGTADHLRCAMQMLSGDVAARTVYGHLGWRKIGEQWVYLHAGGAIGADGSVDGVEVAPPDALARYVLPVPLAVVSLRSEVLFGALGKAARREADVLAAAVRTSLALLELAPDRLAFPLLAAVYRAVLGGTDFTLHLAGQSGVFKTELAALLQQHYGAELDARHLPASWASTGNSLESIAFAAKDALLTVDDFAPSVSAANVARLHREAERLLRAQGNAAGRQRMRADGSLRPEKPPRGLILSTGEDVPRGQSLRARLLIIEVEGDDIDAGKLTAAQRDAADGLYAVSIAGFVRWLAPRYDTVRDQLDAERAQLRERVAGDGQHARTPGIVADLALGLRYLLDFAAETAAISKAEEAALWERGWAALCAAGAAQAEHVAAADPVDQFLRLLSGAIASGRTHVAAKEGQEPATPTAWGWRERWFGVGENLSREWQPQGKRVGWIDGEQLYLEPEAAYAAAQSLAGEQGESLTVSPRTLWKRLRERGLLASWDEHRRRNTVRRDLEGFRHRDVIHLHGSCLSRTEPSTPSTNASSAANRPENVDGSCGRSCGQSEGFPREPSTETVHKTAENAEEAPACGRCGRSDSGGSAPSEENNFSAGWHAPGCEGLRTPFDEHDA